MMQRDPDDRLNYSNRKVAVDISTDSVSTIQEATTTRRKDTKSKERSRILKRIQSRTKVLVMENRGKRTLKSLSLSPSSKERQQEITRKADQDKKRVK
jgi:23S rRNA pseudoU1915 N3-methylase RlmH